MDRRFSILVGTVLILTGALALAFSLVLPWWGLDVWGWGPWRAWPLIVVGLGVLFMASPFLAGGRRALGALFIPGMPILATGGILFLASVFRVWRAWQWLWPVEVSALALGFLFAALYMRLVWLVIPAIILGLNGLVLQFCALTGLWGAWAVLWPIEPLAIGISLVVAGVKVRSAPTWMVGLGFCSVAGLAAAVMTAVTLSDWRFAQMLAPGALVLAGVALLVWGLWPRRPAAQSV